MKVLDFELISFQANAAAQNGMKEVRKLCSDTEDSWAAFGEEVFSTKTPFVSWVAAQFPNVRGLSAKLSQ